LAFHFQQTNSLLIINILTKYLNMIF
jgi:hypothetical protein